METVSCSSNRQFLHNPLIIGPIATLLIAFLVFYDNITGIKLLVSIDGISDLLRANVPTYTLIYDELFQGNYSWWSWKMGIGTTMFSHADALFDPFTYISMICGRENIHYMLIWMLIIKIVFECFSMSLYLKHFKLNDSAIVLCSIMYAFSGWSLVMGSNLALGTILVYFPLLLLAIEKLIENESKWLLLLIIFLITIYSYYALFSSGLLSLAYLVIRCHIKKINPVKPIITMAGITAIALMIASPVLLPQLEMALSSARSNSGKDVVASFSLIIPDCYSTVIRILRSFDINILGTCDTYAGDFFQNEWYVSIFSIPLIIYTAFTKEKRNHLTHFILLVIVCSIPLVSFIMNATKTINYRWMYIVHFYLCVTSCIIITDIMKNGVEKKAAINTVKYTSLTIMLLFVLYWMIRGKTIIDTINDNVIVIMVILSLSIITALVVANTDKIKLILPSNVIGDREKIIAMLLAAIIIISSVVVYYPWFHGKSSHNYGGTYGYDDGDQFVIERIQSTDNSFYRIYKDYDSVYDGNLIPSDNDAMVQSYYGLKNYNSMNNPCYIEFLQTTGVYVACKPDIASLREQGITPDYFTGANLNYINGIDDNYDLLDYLGVKYYLSRNGSNMVIPSQFVYRYTDGNVDVYENTNCYPLAFVNSKYVDYNDFINGDFKIRTECLMDSTIMYDNNANVENTSNVSNVEIITFSQDYVKLTANIADGPQYVSFSIPFDSNWNIYVDGEKVDSTKVNISMLGVLVDDGIHTIELRYSNKAFENGFIVSLIVIIVLVIIVVGSRLLIHMKKNEGE